ncbi:16S rRNA (cytosine(1402)-N(4))-methyltransferase RsmH [Hyphomicrobium sp.]|uniref:16S rRNA (cytosine(1402)-N(4))-methyltransferase RsmH n=1 Tax=Hyphomicrobium sp. TaxID=82 RepID=UPI002E33F1A0|nr:16S rRNA (cytosine(1402)-N(4))-methyltransferase RsmH [Hyphomicrobium sp.]HEX2840011.1 16S rRNA (cytosine(1402)-N(4))-methyltransferase RsmH [Hyphomicrobium sp.]
MTPRSTGGEPEHRDVRAHIPVLISEVLETLQPTAGETYIDGTFGAGGYTRAILEAAPCRVIAIERDPTAFTNGQQLVQDFGGRLTLVPTTFSDMETAARENGADAVDGVVLDIGVSSMQLDDPARGFSFMRDGPLDMRMSQDGPSAADVVNSMAEEDLANIIYEFGEERRSRAIARTIAKARADAPFSTTKQLAELVERVLGRARGDEKHPATRTFQALRIYVNDELGELERGLAAAERLLKPGGRLLVVTFHSLEDRIVKRFLQERSGKTAGGSRHMPGPVGPSVAPSFRIVNTRGFTPNKQETDANPRARSARLRVGIRTDAPAW